MKKIAIASDHAGFRLKETLKSILEKKGFAVKDFGTFSQERCDYPEFAYRASLAVSKGKIKQAVLICKSGIGNSIVANKLPRVRAALCYNVKAAELSRQHNDSNILVLGAGFVNPSLAKKILTVWLGTSFEGGRHKRRLNQINAVEKTIRSCSR
jgi:ribose 5-phosphate isomerase B